LVDEFRIQNGLKVRDASFPLLFNFALKHVIRKVQGSQEGLKLNATYQLVAYADHVTLLVTETLLHGSRQVPTEVSTERTRYIFKSGNQIACKIIM
jgi:hypothetical protein